MPVSLETVHRLLDSSATHADAAMIVSDDCIANMSHEIRTPMTAVLESSKLLIADDRRDNRLLAGHFHCRAGAEVAFAEDGLKAMEIIQSSLDTNSQFDLVLMDLQLPRMDVYLAAEALRNM